MFFVILRANKWFTTVSNDVLNQTFFLKTQRKMFWGRQWESEVGLKHGSYREDYESLFRLYIVSMIESTEMLVEYGLDDWDILAVTHFPKYLMLRWKKQHNMCFQAAQWGKVFQCQYRSEVLFNTIRICRRTATFLGSEIVYNMEMRPVSLVWKQCLFRWGLSFNVAFDDPLKTRKE